VFLVLEAAIRIIDAYYPVLEVVGNHLESLESVVIDNPSTAVFSGSRWVPSPRACWCISGKKGWIFERRR
jgi:hypothetical protein